MSKATDRTKQVEAEYKKIFSKRMEERIVEQREKKELNVKIQKTGETKALNRKIAKKRAR